MSRPKRKSEITIPVKILYEKYSIHSMNHITNMGRGFAGYFQSEGVNIPNLIDSQSETIMNNGQEDTLTTVGSQLELP